MARPTKMTPMVRKKMEEATALDATVEEVCFYAGISKDTYYKWIKKDNKLSDYLTALRNKPVLKARQEVIKGLTDNPEFSLKYLERKRKNEFSTRVENDITTKGKSLNNINYENARSIIKRKGSDKSDSSK